MFNFQDSCISIMAEQETGGVGAVSQDVNNERSRSTQIRKEIKVASSRPPKTTTAAKRC